MNPLGFFRDYACMRYDDVLTQACPLLRNDMPRILRYPYVVSTEPAGDRMMVIIEDGIIRLQDRQEKIWRTDYMKASVFDRPRCVLDGMMVLTNQIVILDVITWEGLDVTKHSLRERMGYLNAIIGQPRHVFPTILTAQTYIPVARIQELLEGDPIPANGSFVFTPEKLPYRTGVMDYNLLQWIPRPVLYMRNSGKDDTIVRLWGAPVEWRVSGEPEYVRVEWRTGFLPNMKRLGFQLHGAWVVTLAPPLTSIHSPEYVQAIAKHVEEKITFAELKALCHGNSTSSHTVNAPRIFSSHPSMIRVSNNEREKDPND